MTTTPATITKHGEMGIYVSFNDNEVTKEGMVLYSELNYGPAKYHLIEKNLPIGKQINVQLVRSSPCGAYNDFRVVNL